MEGLMLLSDNPFDFHALIVSVSLAGIYKILEIAFMDNFVIHHYQMTIYH